jgi:hypothetical protein
VNEIDPAIKEVLTRARLTPPDATGDWTEVLTRARRRRRRFPVPTRGLLLAAAVLIGLGAVAQAETGVFHFIGRSSSTHSKRRALVPSAPYMRDIDATYGFILGGLPRGQVTKVALVPSTTAAKLAKVFGGSASRYPARAGVVLIEGPLSISLYLQGCQGIPAVCPAPVGKWAWIAYTVLRAPQAGAMSGFPNAHFLRVAPGGTPLPDLQGLGHVRPGPLDDTDRTTVTRQHQGTLTLVTRRAGALTEANVLCAYHHRAYATQICRALAKYVAYLRVPHPNDPTPASGDWTRVSGSLGGWRGNLVITSQTLGQAPAALRAAVVRGLAATDGRPITKVPPPLDCVVNPIPCFRSVPTTLEAVIGDENHHGLDVRTIRASAIPSSYRKLIPAGLEAIGAATNAGRPAVKARGYVFTIEFNHAAPFSIRQRFLNLLGRHWGVFPDENILTLYHPFTPSHGPHFRHNQTGYAIIRDLDRLTRSR